jgi:excisionase family DNA binding protein
VKPSESIENEQPTTQRERQAVLSVQPRLLSPDQAAAYLGLGSRWAVRRLMVNGEVQVVRLAGKLRFDREDLDRLIATRKSSTGEACRPQERRLSQTRRRVTTTAPDRLAPFRRGNARTVTER